MIYQIHQQDAEMRGEERGEQKEKINNAKGMLHEGLSADLGTVKSYAQIQQRPL